MEETTQNETKNTTIEEESALLQSYKKLQETTVSKEKYEKDIKELQDKADLYLKAITEGSSVNNEPSEKEYNIPEHISKLQKFKGTNYEFWKQMTELTDHILVATPQEEIVKIAGSDGLDEIIKVNEGMKQMVKDSRQAFNY